MKCKLVVFVFYFLGSLYCVAQEKFDFQWVVGYPPDGGDSSLYGAHLMDFNNDSLSFIKIKKATLHTIRSTASICDKNGNLSLYSNGCQIHNNEYETVEGCDNVNPGNVWDSYCNKPNQGSYPSLQSQLFLPIPEKENQFIYLTHRKDFDTSWINTNNCSEFYHCNIIDKSLLNGKGKSISEFDIVYPDIVKNNNLAACKHANGKDWWIFNVALKTKKFFRLLLTKNGVSGPWEQDGGPPRDTLTGVIGQSVFSPDGKKYASIYSSAGQAWVMDFDRSTGLLSNLKILNYDVKKDWDIRGISFSPNSRFLYVSADYYMYQFDTNASDIQQSKVLLDTNDGYSLPGWPFFVIFGIQQLAPDGKIYVGQFSGGIRQWSVINKPNEAGLACDFKQHSLLFPCWSYATPPIQPYFKLGDTTTFIQNLAFENPLMKCWYNSSSKSIKCWLQHLSSKKESYTLLITDITGRILICHKIIQPQYQEDITLDGSDLVPGVYIINLLDKDNRVAYDKVMVY